jgi:Flp pilus assembly protein TadG
MIRSTTKSLLRSFRRDQRGMSAVEFALLAPLMVTLYLSGAELSQAIGIDRKTTLVARAVADLVAQGTTITDAEMTNILNAGKSVAAPYSSSELKIWVASVKIDADKNATIQWSKPTDNTTTCDTSPPTSVTLPSDSALLAPNTYLIWAKAMYCYKPAIGYMITGTLKLKDEIYMRPRLQDKVCRENVACP